MFDQERVYKARPMLWTFFPSSSHKADTNYIEQFNILGENVIKTNQYSRLWPWSFGEFYIQVEWSLHLQAAQSYDWEFPLARMMKSFITIEASEIQWLSFIEIEHLELFCQYSNFLTSQTPHIISKHSVNLYDLIEVN